ncbi:DNA polymerase/3'-5' exonuclease PolX [Rhodoferax lacus]|uniref:DNA polymerase beta n=1 Tax=Rhodoferax lacus TaxID=2184758 RepID=A0A3E1R9M1_9BURK|nr:DNA polymerase/3'-5' exonuclease PolX [Rhodoferax lacus]RFO96037.1 DNA polymerase/3'-5' exonuclease PolX [Rhodoferax lacus]
MPIANADVVAVFTEIADLLEIENANPFRVRAYRNAARMLGELGRDVSTMVAEPESLDALPGIGPDLAAKIVEIVATGSCALLERLRQELPVGLSELLKIPGLGPRRVRLLHQELGIATLAQLRQAAQEKRVQTVHGFGSRSEQRILEATNTLLLEAPRYKHADLEPQAQALLADLASLPGVHTALAAGSLRRGRETVGDIDLLVTCDAPRAVMDHLAEGPEVQRVLQKGITRCSVVLKRGVQVDLRAVAPVSLGAASLYFTGSKAHNIALRQRAQEQGLKLNEYGLYRGRQRVAGDSEAAVYAALGLPYIEPELREDRGEIAAAAAGTLPRLVQRSDLQGDLHAHTKDSDGHDGLQAMAEAARAQGLHYLAITDHSKRLALLHGLDADALSRQIDRIDAVNAGLRDFVLLKGVEVDILEDGSLDLPQAVLRRLDLVVGAIHSGFGLSRAQQTQRLLRAMDSPCFSLLAHPSGRLINERQACDLDLAQVIRKAAERGCFLELNAHPARLDLDDTACRMAKDAGVLVSINSDAHSHLQFDNLRHGISQARRGWLEASDVLNTRTLEQLRPLLKRTMG